jgi:peptidoglycan hydrolase CwlO-like protein
VEAEDKARDELSDEINQLNAELEDARRREDDAAGKINALDVKVGLLQAERSELLADRDAAKTLLAAHEADMDKLEQALLSLQVKY